MKFTFELTPELLSQWKDESWRNMAGESYIDFDHVAQLAAQWGADQELSKCCDILDEEYERWDNGVDFWMPLDGESLENIRRPKPVKEQIIQALNYLQSGVIDRNEKIKFDLIRNKLESMKEEYFE